MILQNLVSSSLYLLDSVMVGQLGVAAIAGVAVSNRFFTIALFALFGFSDAASVFMGQFYGAKRTARMQETYRFALLGSLLLGVLAAISAIFYNQNIAAFFVDDPAVHAVMARYMPLTGLAMVLQAYNINLQKSLRVLGQTKAPLRIGTVATLSNAILNYVFIFGAFGAPKLGVTGAALGTFLARVLEFALCQRELRMGAYAFASPLAKLFLIPRKIIWPIIKRGLPLIFNEIAFAGGMAMLLKIYATHGTGAMAAMNILDTSSSIFFILFAGMSTATTVLVSHALGANDLAQARSNAYRLYKLGLCIGSIFALLMFSLGAVLPLLYDVGPEIQALASKLLRTYALFYLAYMSNGMCYFIMRAGGDMRRTFLMDGLFFWGVNIPVVAAVNYFTDWSIYPVFVVGQLTDLLKMLVALRFLRKEYWLINLNKEVED